VKRNLLDIKNYFVSVDSVRPGSRSCCIEFGGTIGEDQGRIEVSWLSFLTFQSSKKEFTFAGLLNQSANGVRFG
jgi:hypothetical protein